MKEKKKPLLEQLKNVLINQVGDTRMCPHCNKDFIPDDKTAKEAWKLYKKLFN